MFQEIFYGSWNCFIEYDTALFPETCLQLLASLWLLANHSSAISKDSLPVIPANVYAQLRKGSFS